MLESLIIKCPNCETEYLPGEVFVPKYLIGQPKEIERDIYGKILFNEGIEPNLEETFTCEKCSKQFKITAQISFNTTLLNTINFDSDYEVEKDTKLILNEE